MLDMALLLRVVNKGEHVVVNQDAEEVNPSVEVRSNTCETSQEQTFPSTKASPGCINPTLCFTNFIAFAFLYRIK